MQSLPQVARHPHQHAQRPPREPAGGADGGAAGPPAGRQALVRAQGAGGSPVDTVVLVAKALGEGFPGGGANLLERAAQRLAEEPPARGRGAGLEEARGRSAAPSDAGDDSPVPSPRKGASLEEPAWRGWEPAPSRERLAGSLSHAGLGNRGAASARGAWAGGSPRGRGQPGAATRGGMGSGMAATSLPQINSMLAGLPSRASLLGQTEAGSPGKDIMPGDWRRDVKLRRWLGERDDKEKDRKQSRHKMLSSDLKWLQRSESRQKDLMEAMRKQAKRKGAAATIQKRWREVQQHRLLSVMKSGGK